jgi:signal recognition particle subunit SEC65
MHGLLWLFAFPGFEVEHTDVLLPKHIRINFPKIEEIKNVLQNLGYRFESGV